MARPKKLLTYEELKAEKEILKPSDLLRLKDLGMGKNSIYHLLETGQIPAIKLEREYRIVTRAFGIAWGFEQPGDELKEELAALRTEIADLKERINGQAGR